MRITKSHLRRIIREELMFEFATSNGRPFVTKSGSSIKDASDMVSIAIKKLKSNDNAMQAIEDYFANNPRIAQSIITAARAANVLHEAKSSSIGDQISNALPGYAGVVGGGVGAVLGTGSSPSPVITKMVVNVLEHANVTNQVPELYAYMQQLTFTGFGKMALGAGSGAALGLVLGFLAAIAYDVIRSMRSSIRQR